ncbi:MAG: universal stress protein [Chitinophagaceae bacterium]|nr:universal stress protein [Chitinophagaceae bacterium]MCW5926572.1 universal stress protein [Chitinophagaceae bacterium]
MEKILAAVDFSEASVNAARYAVKLVNDLPGASLTLYYAYNKVTAGSDGSPLMVDDDSRKTIAEAAMQSLKNALYKEGEKTIEHVVEPGNIISNLEKYVKYHGVDMIVMGVTGSSRLEQMVVGSTTLSVINRDICPVLVVPGEAGYRKIKKAALTSDLKNVESNTPIAQMETVLNTINPGLYIVNVTRQHTAVPEEYKLEKEKLEEILWKYNPKSYFILEEDFEKAVADFTQEYQVDLIITVPKKHGFLVRLFNASHTQKLVYNSQLPILAIHS